MQSVITTPALHYTVAVLPKCHIFLLLVVRAKYISLFAAQHLHAQTCTEQRMGSRLSQSKEALCKQTQTLVLIHPKSTEQQLKPTINLQQKSAAEKQQAQRSSGYIRSRQGPSRGPHISLLQNKSTNLQALKSNG
jgi:hypothetical protein